MGTPQFIFLAVMIAAFAVSMVIALWRHRVASSLAMAAGLFGACGLLINLLALNDWLSTDSHNSLAALTGDVSYAYGWGGLPQLAYDAPFYVAFGLAVVSLIVAGRARYRTRLDRAALAPQERSMVGSGAHMR